ncbi:WD repeat-containing protein 87-like [Macrobrachium nipponense]|uniref:WD repeat-containing protein 87-like n=1 Tax=Macrobrachium nipponense TaxID=159736 RepID=UPI0030C882A4
MFALGKVNFIVNNLLALIRPGSVLSFVNGINIIQNLGIFIGGNAMALILGGLLGHVHTKYVEEKKTNRNCRDAIARLEDDVFYSTEMISLLKEENSSLVHEIDAVNVKEADLIKRNDDLENELKLRTAKYEDELIQKGKELDNLKDQLAEKDRECERNRKKLEEMESHASDNDFYCGYLEGKVKDHEAERKKLKQVTTQLEKKLRASQQELSALAKHRDLEKNHGNEAQKKTRILEDRVQQLQRENDKLKEKLAESEREVASVKNLKDPKKNRINALVAENKALKDKIAKRVDQNGIVQSERAERKKLETELKQVKGNLKEAEDTLSQVQERLKEAEAKSTQVEIHRRKVLEAEADRCIKMEDFATAIVFLGIITKDYDNVLDCRVKELRCHTALGMVEEAQKILDNLPAEYQDDCDVLVESALLCAFDAELEKAEMILTQVLDRCPNHERALKGKEFLEQRAIWYSIPLMIDECEFDAVLERITHAQSLESFFPQIRVDLARMKGNVFCKLGRLQEACDCFLAVLDKDEDQEDCRLRLALCLLLLGRHAEATVHLEKLDDDQEDVEALIEAAETLERMERHGCPYDILGVAEDAALKEIERAYRKLALKSHPDKFQGSQAEREQVKEAMQRINYANDILRDADEREEYNTLRDFVKDVAEKLFEDPKFPDESDDEEDDESELSEEEEECDEEELSEEEEECDEDDEEDEEEDCDEDDEEDEEEECDEEDEEDEEEE